MTGLASMPSPLPKQPPCGQLDSAGLAYGRAPCRRNGVNDYEIARLGDGDIVADGFDDMMAS